MTAAKGCGVGLIEMIRAPKHPQAIMAIWLARALHGAPSDVVTRTLNESMCPRKLFVLASDLEAEGGPGVECVAPGSRVDTFA